MPGAAETEGILYGRTPARSMLPSDFDESCCTAIKLEQLRSLQTVYTDEAFDPTISEWPPICTEDVFFQYDMHDLFRLKGLGRERSDQNSMAWCYSHEDKQVEVWFPDFSLEKVRQSGDKVILIDNQDGCSWTEALQKVQEILGLELKEPTS